MTLRLNGPQLLKLRNLLVASLATQQRFAELLLLLDKQLQTFAPANAAYPDAVLETLRHANAELWWRDLVREAVNAIPDPQLQAFAVDVGYAPNFVLSMQSSQPSIAGNAQTPPVSGRNLELQIRSSGTTVDIVTWRQRLAEIEVRVCRIEYPALTAWGTGFLIAPDLVLTNYHVIEKLHKGEFPPTSATFRFDHKVLDDGVTVSAGKTYQLANDWLVDHSPYSARDLTNAPLSDAESDELDYAILRLDARAGDEMVKGSARKWIEPKRDAYDFEKSPALYIVQHPEGGPMKVAIDTEAVIKAAASRVRYRTTTQPGSSGSPCFSANWEWVALHHSGDPKYVREGGKPEYNQGIPVAAIRRLLDKRGKGALLGGGS